MLKRDHEKVLKAIQTQHTERVKILKDRAASLYHEVEYLESQNKSQLAFVRALLDLTSEIETTTVEVRIKHLIDKFWEKHVMD